MKIKIMKYPLGLGISYTTDSDYQRSVCHLINETLSIHCSIDEWNQENARCFLDNIYLKTHNIEIFNELYTLAASKMISVDPEIGLAVLFSFTYFEIFHQCLTFYFHQDKIDDNARLINHPSFILLRNMLNTA